MTENPYILWLKVTFHLIGCRNKYGSVFELVKCTKANFVPISIEKANYFS